MDPFNPKGYSGGKSILFYSTHQMWTGRKTTIKKTVKGKQRRVGILSKIQVKKNRVTGLDKVVEVPILRSYGIDDIGSCIDYLVEEKTWKKSGNTVIATGFGPDLRMMRDKLIDHVEENDMIDDLRLLCQSTHNEIEEACRAKRKPKYG